MFEGQPISIIDKVNNSFIKNPLIATLLVSGVVGILLLVVTGDYRKEGAQIEMPDNLGETAHNILSNQEVKADLSGAVRSPGVYTLKTGSRLSDLIQLGGGLTNNASSLWVSKYLNMSQNVTDSLKVYIPFEWDISQQEDLGEIKALSLEAVNFDNRVSTPSFQADKEVESKEYLKDPKTNEENTGKVNVNSATPAELDNLPGIGPAYAGRIIENRPYNSFDDFSENSNLPKTLVESLRNIIIF